MFPEQYRGGLLCEDNDLRDLIRSDEIDEYHNREHHEAVDDKYLQVLIQLRKMGLLKKEDIQMYSLFHTLCNQYYYFAEKRFRFLVEWNPNALIDPNTYGCLPLHNIVYNNNLSIQGFQLVFENGIRYYPKKKGIRTRKSNGSRRRYSSTLFRLIL